MKIRFYSQFAHTRLTLTQNLTLTLQSSSPASALAANPLGHAVRPPSRGGDSTDGLLSLVEQQEQQIKQTVRQNNPPLVGISNSYKENETQINKSSHGNSHVMTDNSRVDSSRHDALADLIASLSNGSDNSNDSPNSANAWQVLIIYFYSNFVV